MLHYSCDLCGRELSAGSTRRYVVRMEVFAAHDPSELTEEDLDIDQLTAIGELLSEPGYESAELPPVTRQFRYDLCPPCHERFVQDPLHRDSSPKLDFSPN